MVTTSPNTQSAPLQQPEPALGAGLNSLPSDVLRKICTPLQAKSKIHLMTASKTMRAALHQDESIQRVQSIANTVQEQFQNKIQCFLLGSGDSLSKQVALAFVPSKSATAQDAREITDIIFGEHSTLKIHPVFQGTKEGHQMTRTRIAQASKVVSELRHPGVKQDSLKALATQAISAKDYDVALSLIDGIADKSTRITQLDSLFYSVQEPDSIRQFISSACKEVQQSTSNEVKVAGLRALLLPNHSAFTSLTFQQDAELAENTIQSLESGEDKNNAISTTVKWLCDIGEVPYALNLLSKNSVDDATCEACATRIAEAFMSKGQKFEAMAAVRKIVDGNEAIMIAVLQTLRTYAQSSQAASADLIPDLLSTAKELSRSSRKDDLLTTLCDTALESGVPALRDNVYEALRSIGDEDKKMLVQVMLSTAIERAISEAI